MLASTLTVFTSQFDSVFNNITIVSLPVAHYSVPVVTDNRLADRYLLRRKRNGVLDFLQGLVSDAN